MNGLYTFTLELRDRLSAAVNRTGGAVVDATRRVQGLRREVSDLNRQRLDGLNKSFSGLFKSIPFAQYILNPFTIAGIVGGQALRLGVENEMQNASFEVLFGGADNAKKMIDGISAYAAKSTYGKDNLSKAAQTMAGFGLAQEKILPTMRAIGEVAMGDKGRFNSLTLAFSQMSATGQLLGQDLNQMINSGFNPLLQMSKDTGKSIATLKDEMGKGLITADMVAQSFENATKEGGMFYGMTDRMSGTMGGVLAAAMSNVNDKLLQFYNVIQPYLMPAIKGFNLLLTDSDAFLAKVAEKVNGMSAVAKILGGVVIWLAGTFILYKAVAGAVILATKLWGIAQAVLNVIMSLNPVGLIIAGIVALIALIAFLIIKIDGWGETWDNVIEFAKLAFSMFKESLVMQWLTVQNAFMSGLELIQKGWYKLKSLWNKDEANAGLQQLQQERDARAKEMAAQAGKLNDIRDKMQNMEIIKLKFNDTSIADVKDKITDTLGMGSMTGGGGTSTKGAGKAGAGGKTGKTANSIATGGSKTTHVTINLGNLVHTMHVSAGDIRESAGKVRDIVLDELSRALNMAQSNV